MATIIKYTQSFIHNLYTLITSDVPSQNLAKVRQIELEKAAGSWNNLSAQEKQDKEEELMEASHVAKITNILARKTIHTLTFLTESTPEPFITGTMVDKMASTLNYYLAQLVGPKQKELKVKFSQLIVIVDYCAVLIFATIISMSDLYVLHV